ncbi:MAG: NAD(+)/NADH kinase [Rhizobacter sp.]|nr:NAD(+)/NADH kinase [Chlorobiales bacterium]
MTPANTASGSESGSDHKLILVRRKTRLDELVARYNTVSQAQFYVEHLGADFSDYLREHEGYEQAVREAASVLETFGRVQMIERAYLPNFIFGAQDVVVAIGQDGLVANTLKYLDGQPVIGINPDATRWDGVLLPFEVKDLPSVVPEVLKRRRPLREVTMAKAALNDGQELYAVNDLFIGQKTHTSARYQIEVGGEREQHSSSGIIVSTGLGSTGWLKSILTGASAVVNTLSEQAPEMPSPPATSLTQMPSVRWDTDFLYFSVREPFTSKTSASGLVFGKITARERMLVRSLMPENGVIFSDGIESDFLAFGSGALAEISIAKKKGRLVV